MHATIFTFLLAVAPFEQLVKLYDYDRGAPLDIKENGVEDRDGLKVHDISYASPKGGRVTAYLVVPPGKGRLAGLLFMHGGNGNRSSLMPGALVLARTGAVCLLIDSPLNGARAVPGEKLSDFTKPEQTRAAMIQTVVDLRRGVDLLLSRADVDPARIGYLGASYGGSIGGVLAGVEKRIRAYALMVGIGSLGDFARLSPHPTAVETRKLIGPEKIDANLAMMEDVAPIHYIGHAAPSAVFFQNGRKDAFMPIPSVERYHAAGSEPKLIRWYDAGHGLDAAAFRDRADWLSKQIGIAPLPEGVLKRMSPTNNQ